MNDIEEPDPFSDRLSQARELRRISQTELARKTKIQPSSLSHFEAGTRKPSFENLRRIANALEVSTDYLLGRVVEPDMPSDRLHLDAQKLGNKDRELAEAFIKMLGERAEKS